MFLLLSLLVAGIVLAAVDPLKGQQPTISVQVKVVTLPVTVRDKHGQIVGNLSKDDFVLEEDGHLQIIRYFSRDANLPLTLGLLVDTSLSQRNVLDRERAASRSFLDRMLTNDKDRAFVIHFDREVELLQDLTSSREKLQTALDALKAPTFGRNTSSGDSSDSQRGSHHRAGGTTLYDAVYLASNELMKKQEGRKALVVLSDGVDHGSKEPLESAIESAQRADTVVYTILFADQQQENRGFEHGGHGGMGWPGGGGGFPGGGGHRGGGPRHTEEPRPDGKKVLERISKETGGRLFEVSKKEPIDKIYASVAEELRTQYSLGYTPDKSNTESGYRKITLTAKQKDLRVQTREGYYAE